MEENVFPGSIEILINGKPVAFAAPPTPAQALEASGLAPDAPGVALALNREVVPRAAWQERILQPGDALEIVTARQGG